MIHICTPHHLHDKMAVDFLKTGKDLLVEKPMAIGVKEAEKMIETVRSEKRRLGVVLQNRYNLNLRRAKEILQNVYIK